MEKGKKKPKGKFFGLNIGYHLSPPLTNPHNVFEALPEEKRKRKRGAKKSLELLCENSREKSNLF
jgi:hypothetical protein